MLAGSSTRIVQLLRENYGRGPSRAKTYAMDDCILCVLRNGFTAHERTIVEGGDPGRVIAMRQDFQRLMERRYRETIETITGRQVVAFLSQAHLEPDITLEIFFLDRPLDGAVALNLDLPEPDHPPPRKARELQRCLVSGTPVLRGEVRHGVDAPASGSTPACAGQPRPLQAGRWPAERRPR
jgi:uncharacterized protein YbcI